MNLVRSGASLWVEMRQNRPRERLLQELLILRCQLRDQDALAELIEQYEPIADVTGCNMGTIRSRIHYARVDPRRGCC